MLKRLYVHNYKCLVNFEINFDKDISLFLGANGSGKSTIFEVLTKLHRFILNREKIETVFSINDSIYRHHAETHSYFELDIEIKNSIYKYYLQLDLGVFGNNVIMEEETFYYDNKIVHSVTTSDEAVPQSKSFLNDFESIFEHSVIDDFLEYLRILFIYRINPYEMCSRIKKSSSEIKINFSNYAEWFAHLNEKNRRGVTVFENTLRYILPNFDYFLIEQTGREKVLQVEFKDKADKLSFIIHFHELSEGQKVLIALYTLIYCTPDNSLICIDEPENFLALPEIQPWFDALYDQCAERNLQVILISHHPKIINFLASDSGYWFSRENNLTRVQKIVPENESGLSIAELVERGWIYEN